MHVAHRTIDGAGGTIEDRDARRDIEIAGLSGTNAVVAALIEERRKPADLELEPDDFEQIGVAKQQQIARLRLDEVRILIALRDRRDVYAIAADFFRERREILNGGDDFERCGVRARADEQ